MVAECGTSSQETDVILASITSKEDSIAFIAADNKDESCEDENDGFHEKSIMIVRLKKSINELVCYCFKEFSFDEINKKLLFEN